MTIKIPSSLLIKNAEINSYSDANHARKQRFHKDGKKFLKDLAAAIGVGDACDIRSNEAGIGVAGEITLHSDALYVQLCGDFLSDGGLRVLFRSCKGRKDYSGGPNQYVDMSALGRDEAVLERFVKKCIQMVGLAAA